MRAKRLGRGLGNLLNRTEGEGPPPTTEPDRLRGRLPAVGEDGPPAGVPAGGVRQVLLSEIRPNPFQPRRTFRAEGLEELCDSIREHGVLQPVVLRPAGDGFELIAGERRYRAARHRGARPDAGARAPGDGRGDADPRPGREPPARGSQRDGEVTGPGGHDAQLRADPGGGRRPRRQGAHDHRQPPATAGPARGRPAVGGGGAPHRRARTGRAAGEGGRAAARAGAAGHRARVVGPGGRAEGAAGAPRWGGGARSARIPTCGTSRIGCGVPWRRTCGSSRKGKGGVLAIAYHDPDELDRLLELVQA